MTAESNHKSAVAALGCALCWHVHGPHEPGEVELHHLRTGGWGKGDYKTLIPLCYEHHRGRFGIHGMGTKAFYAYFYDMYGVDQRGLLAWTLARVSENEFREGKC